MARTQGTKDIVGWQEHSLVRDLALGAESGEELAEKYDIAPQTVRDFKRRKKARIAAVLADWSNEFSDVWRVKKHNRVAELDWLADEQLARLRELKEDAERATETMRKLDPDAAPVRVPIREWNACTRQLARLEQQIAQEMGQDAAHIDGIAGDAGLLFTMRQLGLIPTEQVKKQHRELNGIPERSHASVKSLQMQEQSVSSWRTFVIVSLHHLFLRSIIMLCRRTRRGGRAARASAPKRRERMRSCVHRSHTYVELVSIVAERVPLLIRVVAERVPLLIFLLLFLSWLRGVTGGADVIDPAPSRGSRSYWYVPVRF